MSQPTATDAELMLSLPIPHELTLMIIEYLDLADLVALYCLNSYWKKTFDSDEIIRLKMFRLPREIKYSAQVKWVQEQWKKTHKKIEGSDRTAEDFWKHIHVNPYLTSRPYRGEIYHSADAVEDTYVMYKNLDTFSDASDSSEDFPERYLDLPQGHESRATDLIDSMFVSCPPVTRTELYSYSFRPLPMVRRAAWRTRKSSESWEESTGYKMGRVYEIAQRQPEDFSPCHTTVKLWPEMLWRIKHGIPLEDDEGEAGRSDDVTGDGNVSDDDSSVEEESEDDAGSEYEPESGSDDSD